MQLDVIQLSKVYRGGRGLLPARFAVDCGERVAIVGHNGAGKSTLLKLLANWIVPDSGQVLVDGIELRKREEVVRKIGFVPENPNLHEAFSVAYNLQVFARLFGIPDERVEATIDEFNLGDYRHDAVRTLSKGLKQRLSIGRSLLADPAVLLLDEPTNALDFEMTRDIHLLIRKINLQGKTILFASHRPEEIQSLATRMLVLHKGSIIFDGAPDVYFTASSYEELYA
jgi:ABC-type multidrug transport system ATPase subunit